MIIEGTSLKIFDKYFLAGPSRLRQGHARVERVHWPRVHRQEHDDQVWGGLQWPGCRLRWWQWWGWWWGCYEWYFQPSSCWRAPKQRHQRTTLASTCSSHKGRFFTSFTWNARKVTQKHLASSPQCSEMCPRCNSSWATTRGSPTCSASTFTTLKMRSNNDSLCL